MFELTALILAAGASQRFIDAGYHTLKPFLKIKYKGITDTMMGHVLRTVPAGIHTHFVIPQGHYLPFDPATRIRTATCVQIPRTRGQAESALYGAQSLSPHRSLLVLDCDVLLETQALEDLVMLLNTYDASLAVAHTFDPNASRVDRVPFPTMFIEKQPISEWGIIGARAFRHSGTLVEALEQTVDTETSYSREPYLSTALNYYPGKKYAHVVESYVDWGTPEKLAESGAIIV